MQRRFPAFPLFPALSGSAALLFIALLPIGCNSGDGSLYEGLQSEDPAVRLDAVARAGELKDPKAVAYLVDRLTDSESEIRMFAAIALEKITGQTHGYRHFDPPVRRAEAVAAWREWLKDNHRKYPAPATQNQARKP